MLDYIKKLSKNQEFRKNIKLMYNNGRRKRGVIFFMRRFKFKKVFSVLASCVFVASGVILPVNYAFAITDAQLDKYAEAGVIFYEPDDTGTTRGSDCVGESEAKVSGTTAKEKVWSGLKSLGLSDEITAGIMGNMQGESGFGPTRYESSHRSEWETFDWENDPARAHGVGLIQWSGGRRVKMFKYMREKASSLVDNYLKKPVEYGPLRGNEFIEKTGNSKDVTDPFFAHELDFLIQEMKGSKWYSKVFNETTVQGAAVRFSVNVEGCARCVDTSSQSVKNRIKMAQDIYNEFHGKTTFTSSVKLTKDNEDEKQEEEEEEQTGCYSGDEASLQALVKSWAWPETDHQPNEQRKPEYIEGIKKSSYVGGGGCSGKPCAATGCAGVDCGGFVHSVIQVSGWDPKYPGGIVSTQQTALAKRSDWEDVWQSVKSNADMKVGDVLICGSKSPYKRENCNSGHVVIYVGKIDGFPSEIASASWCTRAPSASKRGNAMYYINQGYSVYRKIK